MPGAESPVPGKKRKGTEEAIYQRNFKVWNERICELKYKKNRSKNEERTFMSKRGWKHPNYKGSMNTLKHGRYYDGCDGILRQVYKRVYTVLVLSLLAFIYAVHVYTPSSKSVAQSLENWVPIRWYNLLNARLVSTQDLKSAGGIESYHF